MDIRTCRILQKCYDLTQTVIIYLILLGIKAFALVWQEIVREFRYRWDTGTLIYG